jgi:hypothetical protein
MTMCIGGSFGQQMFNPVGGIIPGDAITSQFIDKAAPEPVKEVLAAPQRLTGKAVDGIAGPGTATKMVQAGDPRGLFDQGQSWNSPDSQSQAKTLLGQ